MWIGPAPVDGAFRLSRAVSGAGSRKAAEGADAVGAPPAGGWGTSANDDNAADARARARDSRQDPQGAPQDPFPRSGPRGSRTGARGGADARPSGGPGPVSGAPEIRRPFSGRSGT
ncbi:hypothetical protein JCM4814A_21710 [Streptomyces phaeofaciens JCM 4814]|uniref:Uncharacterized protein n=1 Tax=Streptomyces phaeofaciens TaxID=68254 RepID=A0A918HRH1_9ACTN|nr:hypothetical protein GCM10010226_92120 [Streptomyces phaeofaciens]